MFHRFVSLEQALHTLTQTLTHPETAVQSGSRPSPETTNGPIPAWLREDVAATPDEDTVQDVNVVSAAPDLDHDGREDKYEIPALDSRGTVRLEPYQDSRRQVIGDTLSRLSEPHSLAGQAAHKTLVHYTGERNADLMQTAVTQHTAAAVQEATTATADLVVQYRQQGLSDAEQLTAFQSGAATAALRENLDTPLSDEQLSAVADMVLLPQRRLTRSELVVAIGQEAAAGATSEEAVVKALGMPVGFAGQTGNVRGVLAGASAMQLSPSDLARLAQMIQDGLRDSVQAELMGRGYQTSQVRSFISDMSALPAAMVVPQSTAVQPQQPSEE